MAKQEHLMVKQQQQKQHDPEQKLPTRMELLMDLEEHNDYFDMMAELFSGTARPKSWTTTTLPQGAKNKSKTKNDTAASVPQPKAAKNSKYYKKEAAPPAQKMAKLQKRSPASKMDTDQKLESEPEAKRRKLESANSGDQSKTNEANETSQASTKAEVPSEKQSQTGKDHDSSNNTNKSRIENLRAKLQAKIAEKQSSRPLRPDQVSKRAARRDEKRKRQEEAKKRAKKAGSSADSRSTNINYSSNGNPGDGDETVSSRTPAQDLALVDYGRLTGLSPRSRMDPATAQSQNILQNLTKPKNLHKMLKDAESKRQKIQELKQKQNESSEAQAKLEAIQWKDAFKEADGTRVKDDPAQIKSTLKRKAAKKAKSQKAWQSRTEQQAATSKERQEIRQHNLKSRKQGGKVGANLSRKEIRQHPTSEGNTDATNKRSRAGFEGRKREFLNKEKKKTHQ